MGQLQRSPQLVVGGVGGGHQQVLAQCAGEQVAAGGDQGHRGDHRVRAQITQFHGLQIDRTQLRGIRSRAVNRRACGQRDRSLISGQRAGQQRGGRRLAGTGFAYDGGQRTRAGGE